MSHIYGSLVCRIYVTSLVFLSHDFFTLLHLFTFSFYSLYTLLFKPLAAGLLSVVNSDLQNHNGFCKKIKCKVNLCNIASVEYNYLWMITSKDWLKRIVNIFFKKNCSNFIFAASFHRACVRLFFDFRKRLSFWP